MVDINNNKISLALFEGGGVKGNILEKLKIYGANNR